MTEKIRMTQAEWEAEGRRRFGENKLDWKFQCPVCKHEATVSDYKKAGAPQDAVAFSCIGRWTEKPAEAFGDSPVEKGPCNYAGGGLLRLNPVTVYPPEGKEVQVFAFAGEAP